MARCGLEILQEQGFSPIRGKRVGLVTHAAAVNSAFENAADVLRKAPGVRLEAIFGPEHGLHSQAQDLISVSNDEARAPSVKVHSLYGKTFASLKPTPEQLAGLDCLVIDLQDVGSRYYTFQATMKYCLQVALPMGIRVLVLDRPNPLGGVVVEGPKLSTGYESFVGVHDLSIRHGLTLGELAILYQRELGSDGGEIQVIRCEGWERRMDFDACKMPWVLPSPNMPTVETAWVYPGQCLIEGTNLSEGRGTTRPFEICGAPWIDAAQLASRMNQQRLAGVQFRPVWFRPTFQKHAGKDCGGVQMHVTDRNSFTPVRCSLALLIEMRKCNEARFAWRTEEYEFVKDPIAIDLLFGSNRERQAIESGANWQDIAALWVDEERDFDLRRHASWLY